MNKLCILFVILITTTLIPQQSGGWKIYTSLKSVNDVTFFGDNIWAATTGGAFRYSPSDSSYSKYSKVDGFLGVNLTAISHDNYGTIWFGSSNGSIDFITNGSSNAGNIPDIFNSDKSNKQINSLEQAGDTIIASHDFGISLIDPKKKILFDTYFKFDSLTSNTKVNYAVKYDRIYAANNFGVIVQKQGATNLSAPESWVVYTTDNGLLSNTVYKIQKYNGVILAATSLGISMFNGTAWQNFDGSLINKDITDFYASNDSLYIVEGQTNVYVYANNTLSPLYSIPSIHKIFFKDKIYSATSEGIYYKNGDSFASIFPNSPKANQFLHLTFDQSNTLWVASGSDRTGIGFFSMKDEQWTNYDKVLYPVLPNNAYFTNYTSPDNSVYFGDWGNGYARIRNNNISVFDRNVTGMKGIDKNINFVVVTGFANDSKNDLWILNFGASDRKNLTLSKNDSTFYHFAVPAISNAYTNEEYNLIIDQYDTKWFTINMETQKLLVYFNENKTIDNTDDDKSGTLSNFGVITSLLVDKRGDIWVGTSLGAYILSNTGSVLSSKPQVSSNSIFTLRQQTINCMLVDPINQKWIGTNEGLLLVNSDGTSLIAAYTTKNSPLLSNIIRSIAIDESTGRLFVATDEGIASFNTPSIKPLESFSGLNMYPSPFKLNGTGKILTIDGLIRDTDIKILNISGKLIKQFSSPGGRTAYWDGKDDSGKEVSSGIYIIVAFDKEGNNVATGKIAVLKE